MVILRLLIPTNFIYILSVRLSLGGLQKTELDPEQTTATKSENIHFNRYKL